MMDFKFTIHSLEEMEDREIPLHVVLMVLNAPHEIIQEQKGRLGYQSEVDINGKPYLLRAIIEPDGTVVTIYRTSKIRKYRDTR